MKKPAADTMELDIAEPEVLEQEWEKTSIRCDLHKDRLRRRYSDGFY